MLFILTQLLQWRNIAVEYKDSKMHVKLNQNENWKILLNSKGEITYLTLHN